MFGREYTTDDTLPNLEASGRKRLYDVSEWPCTELLRLNKELLQQFMKVVGELCETVPGEGAENGHGELIRYMEDIFVNMQHLINVMRPLQAAMDIRVLLEQQTRQRRDTGEGLQEAHRKAWELIKQAANRLDEGSMEVEGADDVVMESEGVNDEGDVEGVEGGESEVMDRIASIVADRSL